MVGAPQQPAVSKSDRAAANCPGPSSVDDLLTATAPAAAVAATAPLPAMTASMAGSAAAMAESVAALARNTAADREAAKIPRQEPPKLQDLVQYLADDTSGKVDPQTAAKAR